MKPRYHIPRSRRSQKQPHHRRAKTDQASKTLRIIVCQCSSGNNGKMSVNNEPAPITFHSHQTLAGPVESEQNESQAPASREQYNNTAVEEDEDNWSFGSTDVEQGQQQTHTHNQQSNNIGTAGTELRRPNTAHDSSSITQQTTLASKSATITMALKSWMERIETNNFVKTRLLSELGYICYLASDGTWIVLQLLEETSASAGNHPVQWLGVLVCIFIWVCCLPSWLAAVFAASSSEGDTAIMYNDTKYDLKALFTKAYTIKNIVAAILSFFAIFVTLYHNAPYWKLLIWLTSIPYFLLGAYIAHKR